MCVAFLSLDAELFSRLFTNVWLEKRMENHGGGDKLQCVPLMANLWPQLRDPFPFPKPKATPKPKRNQLRVIVGLQLKLGLGQHGDLLINLTNSALIFADFVRRTRMHLICLKRAWLSVGIGVGPECWTCRWLYQVRLNVPVVLVWLWIASAKWQVQKLTRRRLLKWNADNIFIWLKSRTSDQLPE